MHNVQQEEPKKKAIHMSATLNQAWDFIHGIFEEGRFFFVAWEMAIDERDIR